MNITSSIGFGFLSAFSDYTTETVWLFGTANDRCNNPVTKDKFIAAWKSNDLLNWDFKRLLNVTTWNVQVSIVPQQNLNLPRHNYVMVTV